MPWLMSAFDTSFLDSSKLVWSINHHNWKIRMTSHLKKERVCDVVATLGSSLLQLSSLTIGQSTDDTSFANVVVATNDEGLIDNEVI